MASSRSPSKLSFLLCCLVLLYSTEVCRSETKETEDDSAEKWKKKDVRDYTDADLERLFEQWEDGDEPLEEDELPEWKRPQPKIDLSNLDPNNPEAMLQMTKKGRTLMMFATVSGNPTEKETEQITQIWQSSLFNANVEIQRYIVGSNRALFMLKDGAMAWEVKDFLVQQERCELVTIEGKDYPGRGGSKQENSTTAKKKKTSKTKQKATKTRDPSENETIKPDSKTTRNKPEKKEEL